MPNYCYQVLTFDALKFSLGILAAFGTTSWIKLCGYFWEKKNFLKFVQTLFSNFAVFYYGANRSANKYFWSLSKRCVLTSLFSTMVQIRLASVKGIMFLHCFWWQGLNGTHLRVSTFSYNITIQMLLVSGSLFIMISKNRFSTRFAFYFLVSYT